MPELTLSKKRKEKPMKTKVAAIVVTYNRKELLLENIECLKKQTVRKHLDIIIIDNASTDGTREVLDSQIKEKEIIYINTGANLGGAGGFQYGIRYAAEKDYDFVWVMDDDCMAHEDTLEQFLRYDKKLEGKYGFLSSKVLWKDDSICTMNVQRKTLTKNVKDFNHKIIPVAMASFVSLFLPVKVIKEVGLPIKEFFIWTDDWEYTRRISKQYPCYLITKSVVTHKSNSNIGANISNDSVDRLDRYNYLYRNDVYLYRREGLKGFSYEVVRLASHAIKVLLKAPDNKGKRIKLIWKGTREGFKFRPEIEYVSNKE